MRLVKPLFSYELKDSCVQYVKAVTTCNTGTITGGSSGVVVPTPCVSPANAFCQVFLSLGQYFSCSFQSNTV